MKLFCYGDSNTYGWDPRDTWGMPYENRWPKYLKEKYGYDTINRGQPGREIPVREKPILWLKEDLEKEKPDLLIIMLGTNDVLYMREPSAEAVSERMRHLFEQIFSWEMEDPFQKNMKKLLVAPLATQTGDRNRDLETARLPELLKKVASEFGVMYFDANEWELSLAFDGVHLTEEAHMIFAEELLRGI